MSISLNNYFIFVSLCILFLSIFGLVNVNYNSLFLPGNIEYFVSVAYAQNGNDEDGSNEEDSEIISQSQEDIKDDDNDNNNAIDSIKQKSECSEINSISNLTYMGPDGCRYSCPSPDSQELVDIPSECSGTLFQPSSSSSSSDEEQLAQPQQSEQQQTPQDSTNIPSQKNFANLKTDTYIIDKRSNPESSLSFRSFDTDRAFTPGKTDANILTPSKSFEPADTFKTGRNLTSVEKFTLSRCAADITGKWSSNDGGYYYIRQIGNEVWWFGSNIFKAKEGFNTFSNVFQGTKKGLSIDGDWQDVPLGDTNSKGKISLLIDSNGEKITKKSATGGFGGSEWTKTCPKVFGKIKPNIPTTTDIVK